MSREIEVWADWHELGEPWLMGMLRASSSRGKEIFSFNYNTAWLNDNASMATPPWTSLRELENASWMIQGDSANDDPHYLEWLNLLIAPSSSIGGVRPKAGVRDARQDLWIAKFPGRSDQRDMAAWEMLVHRLAREAGLDVAQAEFRIYRSNHCLMGNGLGKGDPLGPRSLHRETSTQKCKCKATFLVLAPVLATVQAQAS